MTICTNVERSLNIYCHSATFSMLTALYLGDQWKCIFDIPLMSKTMKLLKLMSIHERLFREPTIKLY